MKHEIIESFRWLPPGDMRVKKGAGKKVIIRGRALFAGAVSRNLRKYVKEELVRAARTLVGKPVTINHDASRIVGHVIDAEEEENAIEYVAEINKGNYPQKLLDRKTMRADSYYKKWTVNPISGVSVEADYRHNRCVKCGQNFYDQETFTTHMQKDHGLKNFKVEPRGILMKALSLVEPPEKPGVPGTTIELMETAQNMSRLMETLTTDIKKELEMKKKIGRVATVTPIKKIAIGRARIKEQEEKDEHGCVVGKEQWDGEKCVKKPEATEQDDHGCGPDEEWDGEKCVPKKKVEEQDVTQREQPEPHVEAPTTCPDGFVLDKDTNTCVPLEWPEIAPAAKAPAPQIVPEPAIDTPKVVDPTLVAPISEPPIKEQETGQLPPAPFPTAPTDAPASITHHCPEGSSWNEVAQTCVPDEITADVVMVKEQEGPPPSQASIPEPGAELTRECEPGTHYDPESGTCVPDEIKAEPSKVVESLPKLLSLGEFGGTQYTSMDDCKAKNRDKDDPGAYCADIMRKSHGETVKETMSAAFNAFPWLKEMDDKAYVRDITTAEAVNQLNKAAAKLDREARKSKLSRQRLSIHGTKQRRNIRESVADLKASHTKETQKVAEKTSEAINKQALTESKLRASGDAETRAVVNKVVKDLRLRDNQIIEHIGKVTKAMTEASTRCNKNLAAWSVKKLSELATAQAKNSQQFKTDLSKLEEKLTKNKRDYERILAVADKNAEDLQKHNKTLEERVREQEDELKKHECGEDEHWDGEKCVPNAPAEPTVAEKKLAEMETKIENLEAKLSGKFKGHSKAVESKGEGTGDPSRDLRESAKKRKRN